MAIILVQQQPNKQQHHNHGLSVTVQVKIKHVTTVTAKHPIAYHILKPINLARLGTREELKRAKVQDTVRCSSVTRQHKVVTLKRKTPCRHATDKSCVRIAQH